MTLTTAPPSNDPAPDPTAGTLAATWSNPRGIPGFLTAVNHKQIGLRFIWTAIIFLVIGGIEGLLIRIQLAGAESTFLDPELYNQIFTMHGTTMMFLFAIPMLEGLAMYFVPLQLGTRDLPFPRLNAFGYWCYLAGAILLNWSLLTGSIPDGGWFAYTPLTGPEFSPTRGMDFWLLGVTFVEISGIVGAVELVVIIIKQRAPGMSLSRIPLFSWSVFWMAGMMLIAFPFVVVASLLLEIERKFGAPFYDPAGGGNPLLWQHLFWIFGHPEVYILLIPATGIVSAVVAAHTRRPIALYPLVVAALAAIAIASFGLWVHHMFAVGLPILVLSFFAIASHMIAIPSGIQIFAWIATIWNGRPRWRTPMWFMTGFVFIFVLGGITGVMVATAPFDFQAHDTFFVVAHFHYVIIGGVVFPILGGLHHWFPKITGRLPSERLGKTSFWLSFIGFNVTFFPQHILGLQGMVRRVYTFEAGLGWDGLNLLSTVGAFVLATGFLVYIVNLLRAWRVGPPVGSDPWEADTLEWATPSPPPFYNFERMPIVADRSPLWDDDVPHGFSPDVHQAILGLTKPHRGQREVLRTSVLDARPEAVATLPGNTYWPLLAAASITVVLVGVLVDWWVLAGMGAAATVVTLIGWITDNRRKRASADLVAVEGQERAHADERVVGQAREMAAREFATLGPPGRPTEWWGLAVGMISIATIVGALIYSYFYLSVSVPEWPPPGVEPPPFGWSLVALGLLIACCIAHLPRVHRLTGWGPAVAIGTLLGAGFVGVQGWDLLASGRSIDAEAYSAIYIVLQVAGLLLAATGVVVSVVTTWLRGPARWQEATRVATAYWWFFAGLWGVIWATLYLGARLL